MKTQPSSTVGLFLEKKKKLLLKYINKDVVSKLSYYWTYYLPSCNTANLF